jgi:hypothetical protein
VIVGGLFAFRTVWRKLVLRERIELSTSPLPRVCSTTELPQHLDGEAFGLMPSKRAGYCHRFGVSATPIGTMRKVFRGHLPKVLLLPYQARMDDERQEIDRDTASPEADVDAQKRLRKEQAARKAAERDLRLKAQLRANLQRRKVQSRARREGAEDDRPGDLAATPSDR